MGKDMVMQATVGGFGITPLKQFERKNTIIASIPSKVPLEAAVVEAAEWLGQVKYDYSGLLGGLFVIIGRWFKLKVKNPFQNPHAMFCSEAVVTILKKANYPQVETLTPENSTPQDILEFVLKE